MMFQLFSVYDRGVSAFNPPLMAPSELAMRRQLTDLFSGELQRSPLERHQYVRYPEDFDLYLLGSMDSDNGMIVPTSPVLRVCSLTEFNPVT